MRRCLLLGIGLLALCLPTAYAQHPEEGVARHAVKAGLSTTAFGCASASYEYRIAKRSAAELDIGGTLLHPWGRTLRPYGAFAQLHYRFYLNDQRRRGVMPFFGIGLNYTFAWEHFDMFTGNDGWTILTRRYTVTDHAIAPSAMFGLKLNTPFGLMLESGVGLSGTWSSSRNGIARAGWIQVCNGVSTLWVTRIGWAF